jgi:hypothetical protein
MNSDCTYCLARLGGSYEMGASLVVGFVLPDDNQFPTII